MTLQSEYSSHRVENVACCVPLFEKAFDKPPDSEKGQWMRRIFSNRWLRTCVYGLVTMGCAAIYFGWQQFQKILFQGGVYSWLCTAPGWDYEIDGACEEQNAKVQMLYTVATAMEYIMGVGSGVFLDHLGPRTCGLVGMSLLLLGVILLMLASQTFPVHVLSMILLGSSVNFIAFPGLLAGDFFPGHQALVIAFIVGCQIGCTIVSIVILEVWRAHPSLHMNDLFTGYLFIVWLPCFLLFFFFLPCRRRVVLSDVISSRVPNSELDQTDSVKKSKTEASIIQNMKKKSFIMQGNWKSFFNELATWDVEVFALYYVLQLLQFVYYPTTTLSMFGTWMSDFAGYTMPFQLFFGIMFGWLVDRVGTLPLCYLMNTLNVFVFAFMLIGDYNLQYATIIFNCLAQSYIYTCKYTYVTEIYSPENFGKIVGYIGFLGGLFTFLNIPVSASPNYRFWSIFFLGVSGLCYFLLTFLTIRQRRGINYLKSTREKQIIELNDETAT